MRKSALVVTLLVLLVVPHSYAGDALGSSFGTLSTARTVGYGHGVTYLGVGFADLNSVVGMFDYGVGEYTDLRFKIGLTDDSYSDATTTFGAEFKYQMFDKNLSPNDPFDMALGGMIEYVDFDGASGLQFGAFALGSRAYEMKNGNILAPYCRFGIRIEKSEWDTLRRIPGGEGEDDTFVSDSKSESELKFGLNCGVNWQLSKNFGFFGELQLDGNDGLFLGLSYSVL